MRDKLLGYALAGSIAVHLVVLVAVANRSAARPIEAGELELIRVEVVGVPDEPEARFEEMNPEPEPKPVERQPVVVPRQERVRTAAPPKPRPRREEVRPGTRPSVAPSRKPPGDPGGPLDVGSPSRRGENLGAGGKTPVGWVPGSPDGTGVGSGTGPGVGKPEPVKDAAPGPGLEPAPAPLPDVAMRVCAQSRMRPGPNCERTVTRSFRPGKEPSSRCTVCKPKHVSTLADRSVPELISGRERPKYPELARTRGIEGSVTVEYTIDTRGRVASVKVTKPSGSSELDKAAVDAVNSRKYKPAVQGGIPRNYRKRETFRFALR